MNILLADDHAILRDGVRRGLESAGETVVGEAGNGEEAVDLAQTLHPDIVLMDISMPVLDGVAATRRISESLPGVKVVVLTMHDDPSRTQAALDAGAVAYLSKGTSFAEVLDTLRRVHAGDEVLSPPIAASMLEAARGGNRQKSDILSERQVEILQMIADGQSHEAGGTVARHHPEDGAQPPQRHLSTARHPEPHPCRAVRRSAGDHRPRPTGHRRNRVTGMARPGSTQAHHDQPHHDITTSTP